MKALENVTPRSTRSALVFAKGVAPSVSGKEDPSIWSWSSVTR